MKLVDKTDISSVSYFLPIPVCNWVLSCFSATKITTDRLIDWTIEHSGDDEIHDSSDRNNKTLAVSLRQLKILNPCHALFFRFIDIDFTYHCNMYFVFFPLIKRKLFVCRSLFYFILLRLLILSCAQSKAVVDEWEEKKATKYINLCVQLFVSVHFRFNQKSKDIKNRTKKKSYRRVFICAIKTNELINLKLFREWWKKKYWW